MGRDFQHLNRSQFVLIYGPGSIIETKNGPRLIPNLRRGLGNYYSIDTFEKFEINDVRLCNYIQKSANAENKARIVALPSNAGLEKKQNTRVYATQVFPIWKICYGRKKVKKHSPILYSGQECPLCHTDEDSGVVRFVAACSAGHLDEVDWNYAIHQSRDCKPQYYYWKTSGSSLANIEIECPKCHLKTTMQDIYKMDFFCTGRFPEKESASSNYSPYYTKPNRNQNCKKNMKITQRQSASLRIPDTITLLTIPKYDNQLTKILQRRSVSAILDSFLNMPEAMRNSMEKAELSGWLISSLSQQISQDAMKIIQEEIERFGINEFLSFYLQLHSGGSSFIDLIYEEFESLLSGAGVHKDNFIMDECEFFPQSVGSFIPSLKVYPVKKIRTITVQTGYRRMISGANEHDAISVSTGVNLDDHYWYPGFEGFGEGIFITLGDGKIPDISNNKAYSDWKKYKLSGYSGQSEWTDICAEPGFVWLHTLSHALIKALANFTGYSSASLHERVYLSRDGTNGGILIYNTSPGEDGGMGGLTGTIKKFREITHEAENIIKICSNDPLCDDLKKSEDSINGAACYSCLLVSETSCEHRNLWIDRHLFTR
ncbi:DrmB family protein [Methanocalculus sp. MC3]